MAGYKMNFNNNNNNNNNNNVINRTSIRSNRPVTGKMPLTITYKTLAEKNLNISGLKMKALHITV
jgi:hypothetical protein